MIDITGVDLVKFVQKVYELSMPQGLGFLHFTPEPLSEERAKEIVEQRGGAFSGSSCVISMDYVDGRACKMNVREENGKLVINDSWYDHTDSQLKQLLETFGKEGLIEASAPAEHGVACNCAECKKKHPVT